MGELGEMEEMNLDHGDVSGARHSRRTALKAGVAVGVGVTAWVAPQIGSLGATPAYATKCTQPSTGYFIGCTNTRASCTAGVGFKPISGTFGTGGVLTSLFNGTTDDETNPTAGCPPVAKARITVPSNQAGCRLTVIVHQKNCANNWTWNNTTQRINGLPNCTPFPPGPDANDSCELARASTPFVIGAGTTGDVFMPTIACGGTTAGSIPCGVFWSAVVECNASPTCVD